MFFVLYISWESKWINIIWKQCIEERNIFLSKQRLAWKAYLSTCYIHFFYVFCLFCLFPGENIHLALFKISVCSVGSVHVSLLLCIDTTGKLWLLNSSNFAKVTEEYNFIWISLNLNNYTCPLITYRNFISVSYSWY